MCDAIYSATFYNLFVYRLTIFQKMISFEQCKHVITYYILKIMSSEPLHLAPHIQRDCIFLNKQRGEICANICFNKTFGEITKCLHNAKQIEQVNSIPDNNVCFIDKKVIPQNSSGIQLIIYLENDVKHICIQKKYQKICYAYFKVRNFPSFVEKYIKDWLVSQDWYVPNTYGTEFITNKVLNSQIPNAIHTHLTQSIETLNIM
jgi:hypothetical protein